MSQSGLSTSLYDLSHLGISDDVSVGLIDLPGHYTELYALLKEQYWSSNTRRTVRTFTHKQREPASAYGPPHVEKPSPSICPRAASPLSSPYVWLCVVGQTSRGGSGSGQALEDPAICLMCGSVMAAGPRSSLRTGGQVSSVC